MKCFAYIKDVRSKLIEEAEHKLPKIKKNKFEGKYFDNKSWFDIDFDYIDTNFNTREPEFTLIFFGIML